jgi:histidinol phosphatase-like PHP family hydrolase
VDDSPEAQLKGIRDVFGGNHLDFAKHYYEQVVRHAEQNRPTFIGHFDIVNKYGFLEENDAYLKVATEAMAETVKHVPLFEVSAGPMLRRLKTHPYPVLPLLTELHRLHGKVILSSDTHSATTLTAYFPEMLALLKKVGFTHVCTLQKGGVAEVEIDTLLT